MKGFARERSGGGKCHGMCIPHCGGIECLGRNSRPLGGVLLDNG